MPVSRPIRLTPVRMLKTRVVTALVLLAIFLPGLFYLDQIQWAWLMAVVASVGAWEWGALLRYTQARRIAFGGLVFVLCAAGILGAPGFLLETTQELALLRWLYGASVVFWGVVVPLWLVRKWRLDHAWLGGCVGLGVLLPTWLAIVQLRLAGPQVLLAILAVVWLADVAAYFSGKNFGKHKLAPSISPGKTWEGVAGAALAVTAYGFAMREFFAVYHIGVVWWCLALVLVTAVSVVGDLFESLLKRQVGLKDSSQVLPGHGGVLDRIDSLTSTLPTVAFLWLAFAA